MTKSERPERGVDGKRIWFLSFGTINPGANGGNTFSSTWRVLQIVNKAMADKDYKDGGWKDALKVNIHTLIMQLLVPVTMSLTLLVYEHDFFQFLRKQRGGLPAFRRLIGRPILCDVRLQDVVFAEGHGDKIDSFGASDRARIQLCNLEKRDKILQKQDLLSVREGRLYPRMREVYVRGVHVYIIMTLI